MANSDDEPSDRDLPDESDMDESELGPCPFCGKDVYDDSEWCPHCGKYLSEEGEPFHLPLWVIVGVSAAGLATAYLVFFR